MKDFDRRSPGLRAALSQVVGSEIADRVLREARDEFEVIVREIPYLGNEKELMASQIIGPARLLACVLPLRRLGTSSDQIGAFVGLVVQQATDRLSRVPDTLVRIAVRVGRPLLMRRFRREAAAARLRDDPNEFAFEVVDDASAALALDMVRCAVCTLFERHDAMEIVPYICQADDRLSDALGLGLRRTATRALGAPRCDFRYQPGGEPRRLRDTLALGSTSSGTSSR